MKLFVNQSPNGMIFNKFRVAIVVVMCIIPVFWSFTAERMPEYDLDCESNPWNTGWSQVTSEVIELDEVSEFESISIGETLVLVNEIPDITSDKVFLFYTKDVEVSVFIDNELVYVYDMDEKFEFLKTTGNIWNVIDITSDMSGSDIRIELTSQFAERYDGTVNTLYLTEACEIQDIWWNESGFRVIMSIAVFVMTITAYINAAMWKRKSIKEFFTALGHVCFCCTLWLFSMSGILDVIFGRPITSYLISLITVLLIPVAIYELMSVLVMRRNRIIRFLGGVVWVNLILQFILQFVFGISLLSMLPLTYLVYFMGSICVVYVLIQHILNYDEGKELEFALVSTIVIFVGVLVEIVILCVFPERLNLIGVAGITGLFLYLIINQIALLRLESNTDIQNIVLEENYNKLQNTTLIQQIKAHYFFNTLNTISALCKQDAKEADRAIKLFASYMHTYMHLINKQINIGVEQELQLVKTSLEIELLRFPDSFHYVMEVEYTDFEIPPLSIQPLVENAMMHGLRRMKKSGELRVCIQRVGDKAQVIVSDNGMGFDTSILESSSSIGLKNLKQRIEIMSRGTVNIQSVPGEGTRVIIEIPIED